MQLSILASSITPSSLLHIGTNQPPSTPAGISASPSTVCSVCSAHSILCCTAVSHSAQISSFQWSPLEMLGSSLQLSCKACAALYYPQCNTVHKRECVCMLPSLSLKALTLLPQLITEQSINRLPHSSIPILNCNFRLQLHHYDYFGIHTLCSRDVRSRCYDYHVCRHCG